VRGDDPRIQALPPPVIAGVHALIAKGRVLIDGREEWAVACRGRTNHGRHATEPNRHRQHYHPRGIDYRIIPRFESHNACGTSGLRSLEIEPPLPPPPSPRMNFLERDQVNGFNNRSCRYQAWWSLKTERDTFCRNSFLQIENLPNRMRPTLKNFCQEKCAYFSYNLPRLPSRCAEADTNRISIKNCKTYILSENLTACKYNQHKF